MSVPQHLKQPKSLFIYFLTEMWERYGFYAIQAGLVFFFTQKYHFSDTEASAIIGTFIAAVYVTPIIGGLIADRFLGFKHTIILGGILLFAGYAMLAFNQNPHAVYYLLGFICVGTGLLKANVSSLLGHSYEQHDPRRDSGFTIFYVGINLGTFIGLLVCGYIIRYAGYHWNFGIAALGMVLGVLSFTLGARICDIKNNQDIAVTVPGLVFSYALTAISIFVAGLLLSLVSVAFWLVIAAAACCIFVIIYAGIGESKYQKLRLLAILILGVLHVTFWALYFQMFISINLFIERAVNRTVFGFNIPPETFLATESVGVIIFGVLMSRVWLKLSKTKFAPSTAAKFAIAFVFMALTIGILLLSFSFADASGKVPGIFIVIMYFVLAFGELSISPIGLSMITRLSPRKTVGMMMGVWFFTLGIGGKVAGVLSSWCNIPKSMYNVHAMDMIYKHAFLKYFGISIVGFIVAVLLAPFITKLIRGHYAAKPGSELAQ